MCAFRLQVQHLYFLLILSIAITSIVAYSQTPSAPACGTSTPSKGHVADRISGMGCVETGVEGGCLMITDSSSGKRYNLFFVKGKPPSIDTAIRFEGKAHSGPTTCMEGTAVEVTSCTVLRLHCPLDSGTAGAEVPPKAPKELIDKCKNWSASYKALTSSSGTLHVSATCTVQSGTKLTLFSRQPKDFNPAINALELRVEYPSAPATSKLMVPFPLTYDEQTDIKYKSVRIEDGPTIPVK